jgi:E3 ubiquitin-protein ligase SHPRH
MLEKEGMTLTEEGLIVPQKLSNNFSFWKKIKQGDHTWYLNRLSGELSADPPDPMPAVWRNLGRRTGVGENC